VLEVGFRIKMLSLCLVYGNSMCFLLFGIEIIKIAPCLLIDFYKMRNA
jgi:hypothetical protein